MNHYQFLLDKKEFAQFLYVAAGSASELDTQIEVSRLIEAGKAPDLSSVPDDLDRVSRMIQGLIRSLRKTATASGQE